MSTEPLWRGNTTQQGPWNTYSFLTEEDGDLPALDCRPGTEVEVWRAGDRTPESWDGEVCQDCGIGYDTVYWLPDEVWAAITPAPETPEAGLLCPVCAEHRARQAGIDLRWTASLLREPVGDRTSPTREQVREALLDAGVVYQNDTHLEAIVLSVMALLSGQSPTGETGEA